MADYYIILYISGTYLATSMQLSINLKLYRVFQLTKINTQWINGWLAKLPIVIVFHQYNKSSLWGGGNLYEVMS